MDPQQIIKQFLAEHTDLAEDQIVLQKPKDPAHGDVAFPCFMVAKTKKQPPQNIAQELANTFTPSGPITKATALGGFLNFTVDPSFVAKDVLETIQQQGSAYGAAQEKQTVVLEFPSPNTNKPLHIGHVRLIVYGAALTHILDHRGNNTVVANLLNDRGIHICKSMLAYEKWGNGETPESAGMKGDYLVGKYYVLFSQKAKEDPSLEQEAQEMLQKWEAGDASVRSLWKQMNSWSKQGMDETFAKLGLEVQKEYLESDIYLKGKEIVLEAHEKGLLEKDENGNILVNLEEHKLNKKILLRADGTSIYSTQDVALALQKHKEYSFDKSLYLVGTEQNFYLQQIFKALEVLGYNWGKNCVHVKSGMIYLPTGRMKSREGTIVEADELIEEMITLAQEAVKERHKDLSPEEVEKRAHIIGLGAMRFFFLKFDSERDFTFDPKESISFEGETGPYVQYAHARICSIFRKHGQDVPKDVDFSKLLHETEQGLIRVLQEFPSAVARAGKEYKPHFIVRSLLDIAQAFNNFYHSCPVLVEDEATKLARLYLCDCTRSVLKSGLGLLGIEAPEEM